MSPTIIECGSGIEGVVVYARGAVVTRRVTLPAALPEEAVELRVPDVTALADAGSVRAICEGEREVAALSARLVLPAPKATGGALTERLRALDLERQRIEAERKNAAELRGALAAARLDPAIPRWARRADPAARFADAAALSGLLDVELARLDATLRELAVALEKNLRAREAALLAAAQGGPSDIEGALRQRYEIAVRFAAGAGAVRALALEYVVGAARWWPAYSARFTEAATNVALALDALVAQASGEDWSRVRLSLSTAHLANDARLPELASLRLGRAQPPARRGYRPPPEGLDALFEGHDHAVVEAPSTRVPAPAFNAPMGAATRAPVEKGRVDDLVATAAPAMMDLDEELEAPMPRAEAAAFGGAAFDMPAPMAAPAPMKKAKMELKPRFARRAAAPGAAGYAAPASTEEAAIAPASPAAIEPADAWLDFDALVLADPEDRAHRGRLVREPRADSGAEAAARRIEALAAPPLTRDPLVDRGRYDHRYDAAGTADVPATGRPQRVSVAAAETHATPCFVAVPREAAEVYREVEIKNPFDAPLLAGPVDVFLDGALMTTAELSHVDRAGSMRLGLGVEERLRVARNARVEESTAGLLGGSLVVDHAVTIDLSSSLGRKVTVEVKERVPVTDDKDIDIKLTYARPEPDKYTQAERGVPLRRGLSFTVSVPAGDKAKIELGYRVTLPAKNEIVGGNRRE